MTERDIEIIKSYAAHNMNVCATAKEMYLHHNTVIYHLGKIREETGLDPRQFYDLVELVKRVEGHAE